MTADANPPVPGVRRLSILHLLVWTTFTALFLAFVSGNSLEVPETGQVSWIVSLSLHTFIAMVDGAALTGMAFLLPFVFSDSGRRRLEPGHWILVFWGIIGIGELLCTAGMRIWPVEDDEIWQMGRLKSLVIHGGAGLALVYGWKLGSCERPWSAYLILKAISAGAAGLGGIVEAILYFGYSLEIAEAFQPFLTIFVLILIVYCVYLILEIIASVTFFVAVAKDWNNRRYRDWLHEVAVVLMVSWPVLTTTEWLYYAAID
jgi:hypothetical protein